MTIKQLIISTLSPLDIPINFQHYEGDAKTYITFREYDQRGGQYCDDDEVITRHFLQIDIWSKGNYETIVNEVKTRLKNIGFIRTSEIELYEVETKLFHKAIRFSYFTNNN